ncbi:MAG: DUF4339 domain-containing protein [Methylotenera sp.]|nr:DUF4339 domain-containing protein [Oligoflexia bacterium]
MDTSTSPSIDDKKWFVYISDHHEGPYTVTEVKEKVAHGKIPADGYVWSEGMADWQPMSAVAAFGPPPAAPAPAPAHPQEQRDGPTLTTTRLEMPKKSSEKTPEKKSEIPEPDYQLESKAQTRTNVSPPITLVAASRVSAAPQEAVALERPNGGQFQKRSGAPQPAIQKTSASSGLKALLVLIILIAAMVGAGMQGLLDPVLKTPAMQAATRAASDSLRPLVARFPALAQFISPIPTLDDVAPEDYEELKAAASPGQPTRLAVAVSRADLMAPLFYVSGNLPDGAQVDVWVEGVSDTLLNQTAFSGHATAKMNQKLGKTETLRMADGKPIPRGQYLLFVTEGDSQPDPVKPVISALPNSTVQVPATLQSQLKEKKLLTRKSYFLGGPRDQTYVARLKEFHDRIMAKSSNERVEVKQFTALLESQIDGSIATFDKLRKGPAKPTKAQLAAKAKAWDDFNVKWVQVEEQINQAMAKITPDALTNEYFYGPLYQLTQQTAQETNKMHELHHAFFKSTPDMASFDIQLGEVTSQVRAALTTLKTKFDEVEKLPATASGLPQKMPALEKQP